jgi:hypothetical protein
MRASIVDGAGHADVPQKREAILSCSTSGILIVVRKKESERLSRFCLAVASGVVPSREKATVSKNEKRQNRPKRTRYGKKMLMNSC